jgi:hypothetical protein
MTSSLVERSVPAARRCIGPAVNWTARSGEEVVETGPENTVHTKGGTAMNLADPRIHHQGGRRSSPASAPLSRDLHHPARLSDLHCRRRPDRWQGRPDPDRACRDTPQVLHRPGRLRSHPHPRKLHLRNHLARMTLPSRAELDELLETGPALARLLACPAVVAASEVAELSHRREEILVRRSPAHGLPRVPLRLNLVGPGRLSSRKGDSQNGTP